MKNEPNKAVERSRLLFTDAAAQPPRQVALDKRLNIRDSLRMGLTKPIAWSYTRHSTKEQAKGDSLTRQSSKATLWAIKHQCELKPLYDNGLSAFSGANKLTGQLGGFLEQLRAGRIQKGAYFLIESFDRLSREQFTEAQSLFQEILSHGIIVVTLNNEKQYTKDITLYDTILALVEMDAAHQYSLRLSGRVKDEARRRKEAGKITHNGRTAPGWLNIIGEKRGGWQVDERAVGTIHRIFADAAGGKGPAAIARSLRAEGEPLLKTLKDWTPQNIQELLRDRRVLGEFQRNGGATITNYFPPIIDAELFARVNSKPAEAARGRGNGKITEANLLRGIVFDTEGRPLIHRTSGVRHRRTGEYKSYAFLQGRGDNPLRVRYEAVEERILWLMRQMGEALFDQIRKGKSNELDERIQTLQVDLRRCENRIKRVVSLISGDGNDNDSTDDLLELKSSLKTHKADQARIKQSLVDLEIAKAKRVEDMTVPGDLSRPEVRRAVRAKIAHFFEKIVVEKEHVNVEIYMGFGLRMSLVPPFEVHGFGDEKLGLLTFENFESDTHRARRTGRTDEELITELEAAVGDQDIAEEGLDNADCQLPGDDPEVPEKAGAPQADA